MAFSSIGTFACRALQTKLIDFYGANTPEMRTLGSKSLIRWLLSPQNTRGFRQLTNAITGLPATVPGKKRAVAFALDNPLCLDVCAVNGLTCHTTRLETTAHTQEIVYEFDGPAYMFCDGAGNPLKISFDRDTLAKYCTESDTSYITRQIARFNKRFIESLNKRVGEALETLVGQNALGQSVTPVPFFHNHVSSGLNTINPEAHWWLNKTYGDAAGVGQYALIGGQIVNKINLWYKWMGLADAGIDLGKVPDTNPYTFFDRDLDATLGINDMFMLSPGAVQLVTFNENVGTYKQEVTDLYTNDTFIDPDTGLQIDFDWRYDYDCKIWTYEPKLWWQLASSRPGGCGLAGVNGIFRVNDCSGGAYPPECPES
jgi:hypothetical protein